MTTLRSWFRGSPSTATKEPPPAPLKTSSSIEALPTDNINGRPTTAARQQEFDDIEHAMAAAELIMNDNIEGAEAQFRSRSENSSFHQLGLGVATFMTSILGFEKDVMAEAASRLAESENRAWADLKKAQKEAEKASGAGSWLGKSYATADDNRIYPPGSEYALVHAESQLMNAVVAVMHENLTEGIKGFYKLRKAFLTLEGIMESEAKYINKIHNGVASRPGTAKPPRMSDDMMPGSFDDDEFAELQERQEKPESDSDVEFVDANSTLVSGKQTPAGQTGRDEDHSGPPSELNTPTVEKMVAGLSLTSSSTPTSSHSQTPSLNKLVSQTIPRKQRRTTLELDERFGPTSELFTTPADVFVHSGASMCYGILLLIISMVPPAFSRLLYIIGFKGDRNRGVKMLWQSTKIPNVNGAIAGLILLGYYNGLLGFADILPEDKDIEELAGRSEIVGYPRERCAELLDNMRTRYPDSRLWRLQEGREMANNQQLKEAVQILAANEDSKMRQIAALNAFELSMNTLYIMSWKEMREGFLRCIELNDWSHAMYYYMAGCAELEMYRDAFHRAARLPSDATAEKEAELVEAKKHKKAAEEYFRKAPTVAGRKRFMTRQQPAEVFVVRKVQKWEERAAKFGLDLADAPVISPAMEMLNHWNGSKRMTEDLLQSANTYLALDRATMTTEKRDRVLDDEKDEGTIQAVCLAANLRSLGKTDEARAMIEPILKMDRNVFKGPTREDYILPVANYEMAAAAWRDTCDSTKWPTEKGVDEVDAYRRQKSEECLGYLEKLSKWESFVLDARYGMRVQAGLDSVRWLKGKKGW